MKKTSEKYPLEQCGYFWCTKVPDGSMGMGDLGFNTSEEIIKSGDKSEWAHESLKAQKLLLQQRQRWPDRMNDHPSVVNSWCKRIINRTWNQIRHKIRKLTGKTLGKLLPYRFQGRMSRDPYTSWATACVLLGQKELIQDIRLPWYIYSPAFWSWWKYLKTSNIEYLLRYRFWNLSSNKDFVIHLKELREIAIQAL